MEVLYQRCCGLDVHKETVVACLRLLVDGKVVKQVRTFATTTASLIALSEWLAENKCTHVAMEATGIYWKPVWHILSDGGFVPDTPTQDMRTLMRTRKQLVREKSSHILRIQKTLEDANIKLDSVVTDIMGLSGRKMIEALIAGEKDPAKLAHLADHRVKASQQTLREALRGRVTKNHRFLLRLHLGQIDALDAAIADLDREVEASIAPFRSAIEQVSTIPGVKDVAARTILSEIGIDMRQFPSDANLISWACICPRNDESAGKRRSTRVRKGSPWLKTTLVQCAWAAARTKGTYLQTQFHRIRARRGVKKAIVAVAASILTAIFHMLKDGTMYQDLGRDRKIAWSNG
jgi:transposase